MFFARDMKSVLDTLNYVHMFEHSQPFQALFNQLNLNESNGSLLYPIYGKLELRSNVI